MNDLYQAYSFSAFCCHCGAALVRARVGSSRAYYRFACGAADVTNSDSNTTWRGCSHEPGSKIGLGIPVDLSAKKYMRHIMRTARVCNKSNPVAGKTVETPFGAIVFRTPLMSAPIAGWKSAAS